MRIGPLLTVLLEARSTAPTLEVFVATIEAERLGANAHLAQGRMLGNLSKPVKNGDHALLHRP